MCVLLDDLGRVPVTGDVTVIGGTIDIGNFPANQDVTVTSSVLPAGASTSANQVIEISHLSSIDTSIDVDLSTRASELTLSALNDKFSPLGQNTMANSAPVVIASDQIVPTRFGDTPNLDAFGRLRVSEPFSIFDSTFLYDTQPLTWTSSTVGAGAVTYNANKASVDLILGTASGDSAIFQTRRYFKYHPGVSQALLFTHNFGSSQANVRRRIGQFDTANGVFFELDGTTIYVAVRTSTSGSPVDTRVAQANWNLDKLDGTGASGVTLILTNQQVLVIDYQWLGSGRIRFGVNIGGQVIYAHQMLFANTQTLPYSQTATLPLRLEATNTGVAGAGSTSHITCCSIFSEGEYAISGVARTVNSGITAKAIAATGKIPIISLRKSAAGIKVPVKLHGMSIFCDTTDDLLIVLTINATLTASTFATTVGFSQYDTAATAMTGGTEVYSFYIRGTGAGSAELVGQNVFEISNLILGSTIAGVSDIITISAESTTGAASARAVFNFRELY